MYKNIGKYYIENKIIKTEETFEFELNKATIIYEVMRVIDGQILFLKDHMKRLESSLVKSNIEADISEIHDSLLKLVKLNPGLNKNIKLDVMTHYYRVYFMESFYPEACLYQEGVKVKTAQITRQSPSIKKLDMDYKARIAAIKGDDFEVLLVNEAGYIIEGSRSNLLFFKGNTIYTPPSEEILEGITFKNVIRIAKDNGCQVIEESVHMEDMHQMDACCLTGTSLGVLPIQFINKTKFRSSKYPVVLMLINAYNKNS